VLLCHFSMTQRHFFVLLYDICMLLCRFCVLRVMLGPQQLYRWAMPVPYAGGGRVRRHPAPTVLFACAASGRVRRHPASRRGACAPAIPDSMRMCGEDQARMPTGKYEQAISIT
jgi:hypothetical protein